MGYSYDEVLSATMDYFQDELAAKVWCDKYALRDNDGVLQELTPADMHRRMAKEFARIEAKYPNPLSEEQIFKYFDKFGKIIPQGSPMAGIGNPYQIMSLSNCEVIAAPEDSYGGICFTDQELAQLQKRRCGVGFDISALRPKGLPTKNAAKTTDGIAIFMERFSRTTREVAQGGRRGALLLSISIHHPEIETFINIKQDTAKVTGANVSIRLTDEFMMAVENDSSYEQRFPVNSSDPAFTKNVRARDIWNQIVQCAWQTAEPGLLYWDTVERETPTQAYAIKGFANVSCNPCAELILSEYDSCRLIAINLTAFVHKEFTGCAFFDYTEFASTAYHAQKLMDDMIDLELEHIDDIIKKIKSDPEPENIKKIELDLWHKIRHNCVNGRRTGLGITGLGDTLAGLNIQYGSKNSIIITNEIYKSLAINSYKSSVDMARDRGVFPIYEYNLEKQHPFIVRIINEDIQLKTQYKKYGRRNIANLTTAPTGSLSILARLFNTDKHNITSGIEPAYLLSYTRRRKISEENKNVDFIDASGDKWEENTVEHSGFRHWKEITGLNNIGKSPYNKSTSNDIDWSKSVDIQAAAQKWVCHSLSKTCNIPNDSSVELVSEIYMQAWKKGCKGFTVYRDGCRTGVLIENKKTFVQTDAPKRPDTIPAKIFYPSWKKEKFFVVVGLFENFPYEVFSGNYDRLHDLLEKDVKDGFIQRARAGHYKLLDSNNNVLIDDLASCSDDTQEGFNRLISTSFRHGCDTKFLRNQLLKCKGDLYSLAHVLSRVLSKFVADEKLEEKCPECNGNMIRSENCAKCQSCSYSKC